jgi:hypothetical protein
MTGRKIKIALCLSGEPRSSMFCFPYIYESFINLGPQYEVDVYIHSWKNFRALPLYNSKSFKIEYDEPQKIISQIHQNYPQWLANLRTVHNHALMWSSIKSAFDMAGENYNIYIRCRLDLIIDSKFLLDNHILNLLNNKYDLYIPHNNLDIEYDEGYSDQIFIGNLKAKTQLSKYYNDLMINPKGFLQKYSNIKFFQPEFIFKNYIDDHNILISSSPLSNYRLVRNSNVRVNHNFSYNFLDQ